MPGNDVSELTAKEWLFHSDKVHIKDMGPKSYIPVSQLSPREMDLTQASLKALGIPFRLGDVGKVPAILINEAAAVERFRAELPNVIGKPVTAMPGYLDDIRDVAMIAKEARQASAASRVAKINIAFAAAATITSVALTDSAHAQQRDMAQTLHERGLLSAEALREYRTLSKDVQFMKNADTIVNQTAIGSPIGLVLTENDAAQKFQAFSNKWRLPQEIHVMLGMSIFDGLSLRGQMAKNAETVIDQMRNAPPELQALWSARHAVLAAKENYIQEYRDARVANLPPRERQEYIFAMRGKTPEQENAVRDRYFPELPVARNIVPKAEAAYHDAFDKIFSNRGATVALLSRLPQDSTFQLFTQMAIDSDSTDPRIKKFNQAFDKFVGGSGDQTARLNEFVEAFTGLNQAFKKDPAMAYNFIFEELNSATTAPIVTSTGVVTRPQA